MAKIERSGWFDRNVIATVLLTKLLILVFAYQAFQIINNNQLGAGRFFEIWKRWDAENYLKLAEFGYSAVGDQRFLIVYFPLYPALTAIFKVVTGDYLIAAFAVSLLASVALGLAFKRLVRLDHSERAAQHAVLFLFIFPTSYFLHIPYTESLFLALVVSCFYAARNRSWIVAGCLGGLACLTRINGVVLLPALAFEVLSEYRETRKFNPNWLWIGLVAAGFVAYLGLNYFVADNPFIFMVYQREHWHKYLQMPHRGLWDAYLTWMADQPEPSLTRGFQELLFAAIGLFATIVGWRKLRNSYRVWMVGNWLMFVSVSFVLSVPRYTLILFPIFILMAQSAVRHWPLKVLYTTWSGLFLALFATQFVRGWWAF